MGIWISSAAVLLLLLSAIVPLVRLCSVTSQSTVLHHQAESDTMRRTSITHKD
jgi:hypothetical protein